MRCVQEQAARSRVLVSVLSIVTQDGEITVHLKRLLDQTLRAVPQNLQQPLRLAFLRRWVVPCRGPKKSPVPL